MRWLWILILVACAHSPTGELRFRNEPPVWRVNDRVPLAKQPKERIYNRKLYHSDSFVVRRSTRALDLKPSRRAADVNALDEVPDSTWFTNRIGVRDLSITELVRGPNVDPSPFENLPWTITKAKSGGSAIGFVFEDTTGAKFILKFDVPDRPEMETAAHAIVHRILWACGYNVPQDHIGYVRRADLVIGDKARKRGIDDAKLDAMLAQVAREPDGRIRVLASRHLPGKPIGGYAREGTRADDPNDVIPHERRRSLRGQFALFAWLNHTDLQEDNTLDVFVDDHVEHYLIDFGKALGVMGWGQRWQTVGHTYRFDLAYAFKSLVTFGLWKRPWEDARAPALRGIGLWESATYDPGAWRSNSPYWPFEDADRFDNFWGAKLAMRFTRAQLAAVVAEGQLTDPRAAAYMLDVLVERQRETARYWFDRVAPLDELRVERDALCFADLALLYRLRTNPTRYEVDTFDKAGRATGYHRTVTGMPDGRSCVPDLIVAGYTIVRIRVFRNAHEMPALLVHLARDEHGRPAVIGVRRR
jgi:hypothetical protein